MLKFIQKWLHNNFLKKYGFGWLYRDFFTFPNTFDRWVHINNQNIDNSECFGVKFVKIYPEMAS
jgi:hypothetical protein